MLRYNVHTLADQARQLVREGAEPHLLAVRPALAWLVGLEAVADSASYGVRTDLGTTIRLEFRNIIDSMSGSYYLRKREYPAEVFRGCVLVLLGFERSAWSPDARREYVIQELDLVKNRQGEWIDPGTFRKLPEVQLFTSAASDWIERRKTA